MENNFGIFIRSQGSIVFIIEQCEKLLKSVKSDAQIKKYIKRDEIRGGFKVPFDRDVPQLLQKRHLCDDGSATVHSLTTALVIHEAYPDNEEEFMEDVRKQFGKKVLEVKKVPISEKYPDIGNGKYIIILRVPEVEDLTEFKAMGLPDKMVLELPSCDENLRVEFYCRQCQKEGHVQSGCQGLNAPFNGDGEVHPQLDQHTSTALNNALGGTGQDEDEVEIIGSFPNKQEAPQRSTTMSEDTQNSPGNLAPTTVHQPPKRPSQDDDVSNPRAKKTNRPLSVLDSINGYPEATEATLADEGQSCSMGDIYPSLYDDISLENPSNRPTDSGNDGPPKQYFPSKMNPKSSPDIFIPTGVRDIISGLPNQVLGVEAMENFFNHAKKRSNVLQVAKNFYTTNTEGLRKQLQDTVKKYHAPPTKGSIEDRIFMKWLEGFLKRF